VRKSAEKAADEHIKGRPEICKLTHLSPLLLPCMGGGLSAEVLVMPPDAPS